MTTPRPAAAPVAPPARTASPRPVTHRGRLLRRGAVAGAAAGALLLSGCAIFSPVQTDQPYDPGDGVALTLGDVDLDGLLVVSNEADGAGTLVGHVVNNSASTVEMTFATGNGQPATATVPGGGTLSLSTSGTPIVVTPVPSPPGGMTDLVVTTPTAGQGLVSVPVLNAEGEYAGLAPSASPSPTPSS